MHKELIERVEVLLQCKSHVVRDRLLLGLTTKPRVSGKKGCHPTRQHETSQNIYWGPQWNMLAAGKVKQLTLEIQFSVSSAIQTKALLSQEAICSSFKGSLGIIWHLLFERDLHCITGIYTPNSFLEGNSVLMHSKSLQTDQLVEIQKSPKKSKKQAYESLSSRNKTCHILYKKRTLIANTVAFVTTLF